MLLIFVQRVRGRARGGAAAGAGAAGAARGRTQARLSSCPHIVWTALLVRLRICGVAGCASHARALLACFRLCSNLLCWAGQLSSVDSSSSPLLFARCREVESAKSAAHQLELQLRAAGEARRAEVERVASSLNEVRALGLGCRAVCPACGQWRDASDLALRPRHWHCACVLPRLGSDPLLPALYPVPAGCSA